MLFRTLTFTLQGYCFRKLQTLQIQPDYDIIYYQVFDMNRKASFMVILAVFSMLMLTGTSRCGTPADKRILDAPEPVLSMTLDEALFQRKPVRTFRDAPLPWKRFPATLGTC